MHETSRYYSGKAPPRMTGPLPHFTVIMPVYKEPLDSVLLPTIRSIQAAIKVVRRSISSALSESKADIVVSSAVF